MTVHKLKAGDQVRLLSLPTGHNSQHLPLTVGGTYVFYYYDGSNVCTSTDEHGLEGHYHHDRVEKVVNAFPGN